MIGWIKGLFRKKTRKVFILTIRGFKEVELKETPAGWLGYYYPDSNEGLIRIVDGKIIDPYSGITEGIWWEDTQEPIEIIKQ